MNYFDKSKEIFKRIVLERNIIVYYDTDTDGILAGYLVDKFLKLIKYPKKVNYMVNKDREHGIKYNDKLLKEWSGSAIINVDSSVSQEDLDILTKNNIMVLSLDHHEVDENKIIYSYSEEHNIESIVLNNQYKGYKEQYSFLSGAGVVYHFLTMINPAFATKEHISIVGITLLSDLRDISGPFARQILETTYNTEVKDVELVNKVFPFIHNPRYDLGIPVIDRSFVDFKFSPFINGALRIGLQEELVEFVRDDNLTVDTINPELSIAFNSIKEIQKTIISCIDNVITKEFRDNVLVLTLKDSDFYKEFNKQIELSVMSEDFRNKLKKSIKPSPFLGYYANRQLDTGLSVIIFAVNEKGEFIRGSFRGRNENADYLTLFHNLGVEAGGHEVAFGILELVPIETIESIDSKIPELEKEEVAGRIYYEIDSFVKYYEFIQNLTYENQFRLSKDMHYLKFTGPYTEEVVRPTYYRIDTDGVKIVGFSENIDPHQTLIQPTLQYNLLNYFFRDK